MDCHPRVQGTRGLLKWQMTGAQPLQNKRGHPQKKTKNTHRKAAPQTEFRTNKWAKTQHSPLFTPLFGAAAKCVRQYSAKHPTLHFVLIFVRWLWCATHSQREGLSRIRVPGVGQESQVPPWGAFRLRSPRAEEVRTPTWHRRAPGGGLEFRVYPHVCVYLQCSDFPGESKCVCKP